MSSSGCCALVPGWHKPLVFLTNHLAPSPSMVPGSGSGATSVFVGADLCRVPGVTVTQHHHHAGLAATGSTGLWCTQPSPRSLHPV